MKNNLYIVATSYSPGSAPTNRMLAFLRGFDEIGQKTTVVFLTPDKNYSIPKFGLNNITERYYWNTKSFTNKYLKYIVGFISVIKLRKELKPGDVLFLLGPTFIYLFTGIKGVEVYHERTEHPMVVKNVTMPFDNNRIKYLKYCKKLSGLFVISTSLKNYFISNGIESDKVHIINMIVDSNRFNDLKKEPVKKKYIAYCGNASNNKDGVDQLIKAFAKVYKYHPEYELYIIGKAPSNKESFNNYDLACELGVSESVIFTGMVSAEKIPQLLKNADILALNRPDSLQAQNGFPTKLGEYLLSENPVLVTNVGDIPLFIKDGVNGYVVEHDNVNAFAAKLQWIIENYDEARKVGQIGAQTAYDCFNYFNETNKIFNIIFKKNE